jgi:ATP-dependent Clp protease ATP-binding subunit ClpA
MFERFTGPARQAVVEAQNQARVLGQAEVRAEHLLLGILADREGVPARVLADLGLQHQALVREVALLGAADADALRTIGIDLAAVRRHVEATFGPGALDRPAARRGRPLGRRVRGGGHVPFTRAAKRALEQSLRQALDLRHNFIGAEHLLLGLLAADDDPAGQTLQRLGIDPATVRTQVRAALRRAA